MELQVTLKGTSPLLLHAMPPETLIALLNSGAGKRKNNKEAPTTSDGSPDLRAICARHLYTDTCDQNRLVIPAAMLFGAFRGAGRYHKLGKTQISTRDATILPSFFRLLSTDATIIDPSTKKQAAWEVDLRRAVNEAAKVAVCAVRPRFDRWQLTFGIDVDTTLVQDKLVRDIIDTAGKAIGIGSFRPSKGGIYGQFVVTQWTEVEAAVAAAE